MQKIIIIIIPIILLIIFSIIAAVLYSLKSNSNNNINNSPPQIEFDKYPTYISKDCGAFEELAIKKEFEKIMPPNYNVNILDIKTNAFDQNNKTCDIMIETTNPNNPPKYNYYSAEFQLNSDGNWQLINMDPNNKNNIFGDLYKCGENEKIIFTDQMSLPTNELGKKFAYSVNNIKQNNYSFLGEKSCDIDYTLFPKITCSACAQGNGKERVYYKYDPNKNEWKFVKSEFI